MAPEQARGEIQSLDARSDVFGLGAMLCTILTGRPPFGGENALSTLRLAAAGDLTDAQARLAASGADPELVLLCIQCLAADPRERPADGEVVAAAVTSYREGVEDRLREAEVARAAEAVKVERGTAAAKLPARPGRRHCRALALAGVGAWVLHTQEQRRQADAALRAVQAGPRSMRPSSRPTPPSGRAGSPTPTRPFAWPKVAWRISIRTSCETPPPPCGPTSTRAVYWTRPSSGRWAVSGEKTGGELSRPGFQAAFARVGLDIEKSSGTAVAEAVTASRIRDRLVAGLDDWLQGDPEMPGLVDARLKAADPDPFRTACRVALGARDLKTLRELIQKADPAALPPSFVAAIGNPTVLRAAEVVSLLRAAAARHPDHFPLALAAGAAAISPQTPEAVAEGLGYFRAAVALRPDNARARLMLVTAYSLRGEHDAAIAEARKAARLAPKCRGFWRPWAAPARTPAGSAKRSLHFARRFDRPRKRRARCRP